MSEANQKAQGAVRRQDRESAKGGIVRRRVVMTGRVQGVFFRDSCRREAIARGVGGWIRNNHDGTVEAVFEGDEPAVAEVIRWCRVGPSRAHVTGVEVIEEPPESAGSHFAVR